MPEKFLLKFVDDFGDEVTLITFRTPTIVDDFGDEVTVIASVFPIIVDGDEATTVAAE